MKKVLLILVDGMRPDGMMACGHPEIEKLRSEGASTLAGTTVMPSVTLPCHMSLIHSVDPQRHGILTNTYTPQVRPILGLFDKLSAGGKKTAFFYNWGELRDLYLPGSLAAAGFISGAKCGYDAANLELTKITEAYLKKENPDFTFLYLGEVDEVGHRYGWMGPEYLDAISRSFDCIRRVREAASEDTVVMVTADHGGHDRGHGTDMPEDMTIPFIAWNGPWPAGYVFPRMNIKDIAPTVAKLLGVERDGDWEGEELL